MSAIRNLFPILAFLILSGFVFAAQQAPATPSPVVPPPQAGIRVAAVPQVDPPEPAQGQGVDFSVRVLDGTTGNGLSGVSVELRRNPPSLEAQLAGRTGGMTPAQVQAALQAADRRVWSYTRTTDNKGNAPISNMMAATYSIRPTIDGYTLATGSTDTITLTPAGKPAPITLRMWKAVSVEGTVVDPEKNPVANVSVEILTEGWTGGVRTMALAQPAIRTDATGAFKFPAIVAGTYYLRAKPPAALVEQQLKATPTKPTAFADTMYPNALYMEQAAQILVNDVNLFGIRVEMQSSPYFTLTGRVFGIPPEIKNSGLVFMRRVSFDSPFPFLAASPYAGALDTELSADGSFTSQNLPPGPYWAGYTPAGPIRGGTQFLISDRNVENFSFEVVPGVTFSGRAVYEDGTPVEAGKTATLGVFAANMGVYPRSFVVGPNGEFSASGLPVGSYRMDFSDGLVIRKVQVNSRDYSGGDFDLVGTPPAPAIVTLSRKGGVIQGSVDLVDRAKSFPRGLVTIAKQPFRATDTVKRKFLDGGLNFDVQHLESGRYRVCAWLEEGTEVNRVLDNPAFEKRLAAACESVELSDDERRQVTLKQVSTVDFKQ